MSEPESRPPKLSLKEVRIQQAAEAKRLKAFQQATDSSERACLRALFEQTKWNVLRAIFKDVVEDALEFYDNPRQELQQRILQLLDPEAQAHWPLELKDAVQQHQWTWFEKDCVRWAKVGDVMDRGFPGDAVLGKASDELLGGPAAGGPDSIKAGAQRITRLLPPALRRQRRPRGPNRLSKT